jgi:magnesium chelatase subunit D
MLGCLAADPALGGILMFDLDPALLEPLATWMKGWMPAEQRHPVVNVSALRSIEELWRQTGMTSGNFAVRPGVAVEADRIAPIMLIPDLSRLRPGAAKIAVSLIGAGVAVADVGDETVRWRPRARWLAAVPHTESRRLSPHLLDRFTLRVNAGQLRAALMPGPWLAARTSQDDMTANLRAMLAWATPTALCAPTARPQLPSVSAAAAARAVTLVAAGTARRELALARVARVLAAWAGADQTAVRHVDEAAELLGYRFPEQQAAAPTPAATPRPAPVPPARQPNDAMRATREGDPNAAAAAPPAEAAGPARPVTAAMVTALPLYPEDTVPDNAALDPSRAGRLRARPGTVRSHAIGSLPASDTSDLAILATVLEASKFQRARRKNKHASRKKFFIIPSDLRRPRYLSDPANALVMVLDNTCWQGWNRSAALAPYLRRALDREATVSVIEFGFAGARSDLAAERYRAPSLRDPKVLASLNRGPGQASPLAHALDLALSDLRRRIRHGATQEQRCVLVVATDGRGNVPLADSLLGLPPRDEVGRRGVMDAERVAGQIAALGGGIEIVVVAPDLGPYRGLPFELADGLGGAQVLFAPRSVGGATRP